MVEGVKSNDFHSKRKAKIVTRIYNFNICIFTMGSFEFFIEFL